MTNVKRLPGVQDPNVAAVKPAPVQLVLKSNLVAPAGANTVTCGSAGMNTVTCGSAGSNNTVSMAEAVKAIDVSRDHLNVSAIKAVTGNEPFKAEPFKAEPFKAEPAKPQIPHLGDTNIMHTNLDSAVPPVPVTIQVQPKPEVTPPPLPAEMIVDATPAQIHLDTRNLLANVPLEVLPSLLAGNMLRLTKTNDIAVGLHIIFQFNKRICLDTQSIAMRRILDRPACDDRANLITAWANAMRALPVC